MAENKKAEKPKKITFTLPMIKDPNASQDEFVSVNFKNYIIKRGKPVTVPYEVYEALQNSEKADEAAMAYAASIPLKE